MSGRRLISYESIPKPLSSVLIFLSTSASSAFAITQRCWSRFTSALVNAGVLSARAHTKRKDDDHNADADDRQPLVSHPPYLHPHSLAHTHSARSVRHDRDTILHVDRDGRLGERRPTTMAAITTSVALPFPSSPSSPKSSSPLLSALSLSASGSSPPALAASALPSSPGIASDRDLLTYFKTV